MDIKVIFKNVFNAIKKHAGTIYAGAAVVGVGATVYLSGKAAVEVDHKIEPDMSIHEKAKIYARAYWKTILVSGVTVGSIVMSDRTHVHGKAVLAGALAMANERYKTLNDTTRVMIGDDAADDIHKKIAKGNLKNYDYFNIPDDAENKPLYFYEPLSGQCIDTTYTKLLEALLETNFRLQKDMSVEFNVLTEWMGGEAREETANLYWDYNNDAQNYNASYVGGFVVDFTEEVWDEIKYWAKSDVTMMPDDRINIHYLLYPEETEPWE